MKKPVSDDVLRCLLDVVNMDADLEDRCKALRELRGWSRDADSEIDRYLLSQFDHLRRGLQLAETNLADLTQILDRWRQLPWALATYRCTAADGRHAMVLTRGESRLVVVSEDVPIEDLETGDTVFLDRDRNVLMGKSELELPPIGETATFQRYTDDGRIVLRWREEEMVVESTRRLTSVALQEGDVIRWSRETYQAFERLSQPPAARFFATEVPDARPQQVGGQGPTLQKLLRSLTAILHAPDLAAKYDLNGRQTILLHGPPGCGKTLMARVAAAEIRRITDVVCHLVVLKPAEWENEYVGVTQRNIRDCFASMNQAAGAHDFVLVFMDEVESIGRLRGNSQGYHSDKFLAAFLSELDGFTSRGRVAIIAATNRKDLLDPALLERLSDLEFAVGRPGMQGAREIFDVHLHAELPYHATALVPDAARDALIDLAVSRLFAPNARNQLSTVQFRDGSTRTIVARDLVSGRLIEQICRAARQTAYLRESQTGEAGIRAHDIEEAVEDAIERLSTTLSPRNIRAYLHDLPQDRDVLSVEPVVRRVRRAHQFRTSSV